MNVEVLTQFSGFSLL